MHYTMQPDLSHCRQELKNLCLFELRQLFKLNQIEMT